MSDTVWSSVHDDYKKQDWINKPSLFAETAVMYFPKEGNILELGAGQGQDSRYFAKLGYNVVSTDFEETALRQNEAKLTSAIASQVTTKKVDLRHELPFEDESFDVVYAHLSLHYFDRATTYRIFSEIHRVLRPHGVLAFFTNSVEDPEYNSGIKLEENYFMIDKTAKRYFDVSSAALFAKDFSPLLLDNKGETYKDRAKGVHNLIRFIGTKR